VLLAKTADEPLITGVGEHGSHTNHVDLFPNPVADNLLVRIDSDVPGPVEISVHSTSGQRLESFQKYYDGGSAIKLNMSSFPQGLYLLSVRNQDGTSISRVAIIR
jgi:hypothetical protein